MKGELVSRLRGSNQTPTVIPDTDNAVVGNFYEIPDTHYAVMV